MQVVNCLRVQSLTRRYGFGDAAVFVVENRRSGLRFKMPSTLQT